MAIEKRTSKDGKPAYRVRIAGISPITGKRENKTIGTYRTKREAEKAEREALTQQERGTLVDPKKMTVSELLDAWLATKANVITSNSHKDYEMAIRLHLKPVFGTVKVQQLTAPQVQGAYDRWLQDGMSPRMIHRCHLVLNQAIARGVRFGLLARNICHDVEKPSLSTPKPTVWSPAEAAAFLNQAKSDALAPLWYFLCLEGMRRGEALGLRWRDLNLERGTAHIVQSVLMDRHTGGTVIQERTKTRTGARTVRLTTETVAVLKGHQDRQASQRQAAGDRWQDHGLVVCTSTGTPINPNNVTRSYDRLVMLSGVPRIRVHDMRHTAATMLLRAGVPAKIVSERLGHATIAITLDTYSHVLPDMQDVAAEAMSALLNAKDMTA